jgi:murein DD-endopeptidase MepM/ murein hydrolase activator NlpD
MSDYHGMGEFRGPSSNPVAHAPTSRDGFKVDWPVGTVHINRGFHTPQGRHHDGLDLGGSKGSPIFAAHNGTVIYAGHRYHGYGNMVIIEYDKEWASLYGHLDRILVKQGQSVSMGYPIGAMGRTGHATGVHLHFELLHHQLPVDPLKVLGALTCTKCVKVSAHNYR